VKLSDIISPVKTYQSALQADEINVKKHPNAVFPLVYQCTNMMARHTFEFVDVKIFQLEKISVQQHVFLFTSKLITSVVINVFATRTLHFLSLKVNFFTVSKTIALTQN